MDNRRNRPANRSVLRLAALTVLVLLASALGGCFVSDRPLIDTADAAFPFQRLVYKSVESDDIITLIREGDVYLGTSREEPETLAYLFKSLAPDTYLVQVRDATKTPAVYYYGYIAVDQTKKTVLAYKIIAGERETGDGLRPCRDGSICIDRLDDYLTFVESAIAGGETPEGEFRILEME